MIDNSFHIELLGTFARHLDRPILKLQSDIQSNNLLQLET